MYKFNNSSLPVAFRNMFCVNAAIHDYETRSSHKLHVRKLSSELGTRSVRYSGVIFLNEILDEISGCITIDTFKKHLKRYLLEK